MSRPIVRIYTGEGKFIDREMNDDEFAQYEIDQANAAKRKAEAEAKEAKRQEILNRLGVTAEELNTILG